MLIKKMKIINFIAVEKTEESILYKFIVFPDNAILNKLSLIETNKSNNTDIHEFVRSLEDIKFFVRKIQKQFQDHELSSKIGFPYKK